MLAVLVPRKKRIDNTLERVWRDVIDEGLDLVAFQVRFTGTR